MSSPARDDGWRPIATLPDAYPEWSDDTVLVWSPCDGLHALWLASGQYRGAAGIVALRIYSHWQPSPAPPAVEGVGDG